ncbi:carbonate dehydratase [Chitinimonas sp. BJB300]|nr:carbonate dehydratase [Chitinimonas sp. BJB300]TSJ90173.1 carbonic anhydrase family protein [Chitinimonas sp. BJB300]
MTSLCLLATSLVTLANDPPHATAANSIIKTDKALAPTKAQLRANIRAVKPAATKHGENATANKKPSLVEHEEEDLSHWSYEGKLTGPARWGTMNSAYSQCVEGKTQSPINIEGAVQQKLDPLKIAYGLSKLAITNNGHTIQVNIEPGSWLEALGERYELKQFHFHTPSEEAINGRRYPLVAHMVHMSEAGTLAVIAVLFKEGRPNPTLEAIWPRIPTEHNETRSYSERILSPASLLPDNLTFYTFKGSLTTPPCSEEVRWLVLKTPVEISSAQIERFRQEYPMNARPLQPLNDREVLESK